MPKFRKKPVEIEAVKVSDVVNAVQSHQLSALPEWVDQNIKAAILTCEPRHVNISTREGIMRGDFDDMIIQGVKGELYPCKPDIFAATYEPVE